MADSCIQDVRSNCHLTEETARPRLRVLTKMNGRLYSLVPIHLEQYERGVNTETPYSVR